MVLVPPAKTEYTKCYRFGCGFPLFTAQKIERLRYFYAHGSDFDFQIVYDPKV